MLSALTLVAALTPTLASARADDCTGGLSPLVIDIKGDGLKLGPAGVGVRFDLTADGVREHMQWTRRGGDEAFLVIDLNGNGVIDDGAELFGEGTTLLLTGEKAVNGFVALAQYDLPSLGGNDDGEISRDDAIWPLLKIWTDANADGKSQRAELSSPKTVGLTAFGTIPKFKQRMDSAGNYIPYYAWVTRTRGAKVLMVDVFFKELP